MSTIAEIIAFHEATDKIALIKSTNENRSLYWIGNYSEYSKDPVPYIALSLDFVFQSEDEGRNALAALDEIILQKSQIPSVVIDKIKYHFSNVNYDTYGNEMVPECVTRMFSIDETGERFKLRCVIKSDSVDVYGILRY